MIPSIPVVSAPMKRMDCLESIRGIGSLQVLLLHCFTAFAPGLTNFSMKQPYLDMVHQSPLFFVYDGYSSVYIFFILSGMVLSFYFGTASPRAVYIFPRIVRLLVPAVAAVAIGFAVKIVFGSPNVEAGALIHSEWLSSLWLPPAGFGFVLEDGLVNALWLGYGDASTWSWLNTGIPVDPIGWAYAAPLWTLSIEMQGSLLILLLCLSFKYSRVLWALAVVISSVALFRTHFLCFIVGHLVGLGVRRYEDFRLGSALCVIFMIIGIVLCMAAETGQAYPFSAICNQEISFALPCSRLEQKVIGSIFIFLGVVFLRDLRRLLESTLLVGLGKISFSLYLVHWPIVFGLGSSVFLLLARFLPVDLAGAVTVVFLIPVCLIAALLFRSIDLASIDLSRKMRRAIDRIL